MRYSDHQRIRKIYENAVRLSRYIDDNHITREAILSEYSLQWLVTTPLYNIGEHVYNLSTGYKQSHSEIQWSMIAGLRHRLVHDYDGTNWNIIVEVIFEELPLFIKQVEALLQAE
ncbi:MAG: HepT-like ribonuclease domain-containing protein [bacterium]